ncbi:MAG TPA: hypothetical protein VHM02_09970, partial [Thermoanaerobaculia bacterium]|nr:hypothetical protein [Thermoanaerobaculia bacterium]
TADAAGEVRLPPRPGRMEIAAEAPGYRAAAAPTVVEVPDPPVDREVVLALDRDRRPARPAGR